MKFWHECNKKRFLNKMIVVAISDGDNYVLAHPKLILNGSKTDAGDFHLFSIYDKDKKNFYSWEDTKTFAQENDMSMIETNIVTIFSILGDFEKYLLNYTEIAYLRPYNQFLNKKNMCIYEEQTKL